MFVEDYSLPTVTPTIPDLSKPTPEALSYLLRHKELWPQDFHWHYASCYTCAMGLAAALWKEIVQLYDASTYSERIAEKFNMDHQDAKHIFIGDYGVVFSKISPEMVANRIDAWRTK